MHCVIEMINATTGESIYKNEHDFAFALNCKCELDAGRRRVDDAVKSALRGTRIKNEPYSVLVTFNNTKDRLYSKELPFQPECDEVEMKF